MRRRTFLKLAGAASLALAGGCSSDTENRLFSLVKAPDDMVTGRATWYASTCRECPAGCGILAKNREGRVIKVEGNPAHPVNQGRLCMRGQAALQGLYHPDRLVQPLQKTDRGWQNISYDQALPLLQQKAQLARDKGPDRVRLVSELVSDPLMGLMAAALERWNSNQILIHEPFAYEPHKQANEWIWGSPQLPAYRIEASDLLVTLGADFLETWLSPVAYARQFKQMHALSDHHEEAVPRHKGVFACVAPFQSLTGANADLWLGCKPGTEAVVALGLLRVLLNEGQRTLPGALNALAKAVSRPYDALKVAQTSGVDQTRFENLAQRLLKAHKPLVLGTGLSGESSALLAANVAAQLLNLALDPDLPLLDFDQRHRVEKTGRRADLVQLFNDASAGGVDLLILNQSNPAFALPDGPQIMEALQQSDVFVVSISAFMDESAQFADLILPPAMALESWDAFDGHLGVSSTLQPAMGRLLDLPQTGDIFLRTAFESALPKDYKAYLIEFLQQTGALKDPGQWPQVLQKGGWFDPPARNTPAPATVSHFVDKMHAVFDTLTAPAEGTVLLATPSVRYYDGRSANRPWLSEIPDSVTQITWQTPLMAHPDTLRAAKLKRGDLVRLQSQTGTPVEAPVYDYAGVYPGVYAMPMGQGHTAYGRWAQDEGLNPFHLMDQGVDALCGGGSLMARNISLTATGRAIQLANVDGSRLQYDRKIALSADLDQLGHTSHEGGGHGLTMNDFPLTLPTEAGYDPKRDIYPPHSHDTYRWGMVVDLDRCIGCGACVAGCYAENNLGLVGADQIKRGREMTWLRIERYEDPQAGERLTFLPMMCQHCDNAPCEAVCPVYAPHHSKEGLNNQIYNRCIGTRFCAQNCPYKVRRFNWYTWKWPKPMHLQLNPTVTVRSKGVMEKCSFCIQRIKFAHGEAKNEKRTIRDGEVVPACVQTCPTQALTFGSYMDPESRLSKLVKDPRAYQVMGYLNTKPAVIYLKKVTQAV